MSQNNSELALLLKKQTEALVERENELSDKIEELAAQKEELTAAIEEVVSKNNYLNTVLVELRERNEELDQLVYRASHDLKAPISSTLGILNLLQIEKLSPLQQEYTDRISSSMHKMNDLLRSLSLFTKAALEEVRNEFVPIHDLLIKSQQTLSFMEGYNQVDFQINANPDLVFNTDATLLLEALKAVIANSIIFRNSGVSKVQISAALLQNSSLTILIEDNGEGMTGEVAQQAFNLFYRGSEKSKGSGLGLYMARKIIHRLGGSINLSPQPSGLKVEIIIAKI